MIFNSLTFLTFLLAVCVLYWLLPRRPRIWMLVAASITFYGFWSFAFVPLLMASVVVDYCAGLYMAGRPDGWRRTAVMVAAVTANLSLLVFFKYAFFFAEQVDGLARLLGMDVAPGTFSLGFHIILPWGISFYTFQSMSYTIDVWRRNAEAERDFGLFAAYVIYFPQLVAGPILRAGEVIWQLDRRPDFSWENVSSGASRILSGLFLKCVLADNIAPLVNRGFALPPAELGGVDVLTLSFLFGFQIYFDFAGYSLIAIGAARTMGIYFPENFNFPYLADSPRDFWKRWHISLSSWIQDYLYLPLCGVPGGRQSGHGLDAAGTSGPHPVRRIMALWVTWFLMGLWHGANWTFAVWGLWHAGLVSLYRLARRFSPWQAPFWLSWPLTLIAVMLGWIPFRAESIGQTLALWGRLVSYDAWLRPAAAGGNFPLWMGLHRDSYYAAGAVMVAIIGAYLVDRWVMPWLERRPAAAALAEGAAFAFAVPLVFFFLRQTTQFIYFQF